MYEVVFFYIVNLEWEILYKLHVPNEIGRWFKTEKTEFVNYVPAIKLHWG